MIYAFTDGSGYYQVELAEGEPLPAWTNALTSCDVVLSQQDPKDAIRAQINALYAASGVDEKSAWLIDSGMASMVALAATQGLTEPQLYAVNPGYKQVKDVATQIAALKAQL